jgi:uncharacterized protein
MLGSLGGAWLSQWLSGRVQLLLFAAVMLFAAWRMLMNSRRGAELQPSYCRPYCLLGLGTGIGLLSGLVGVGGGFLIVPSLVLLGGLTMPIAVGTSLVIICLSSFTGFAKHLHLLQVSGVTLHWPTLGVFVLVGALGSLASTSIGRQLPQARLQQIYSGTVVVMAVLMLWHSLS